MQSIKKIVFQSLKASSIATGLIIIIIGLLIAYAVLMLWVGKILSLNPIAFLVILLLGMVFILTFIAVLCEFICDGLSR